MSKGRDIVANAIRPETCWVVLSQTRSFPVDRIPEGEGIIPNITPHKTGIADWTEKHIIDALETGLTPEFDTFGGSMVKVQENMAKLSAEDRAAIAAYLKSLKPVPSSTGASGKSK